MDLLYELLTISDLDDKIISLKKYTRNIRKYALQMRAFLPLFADDWRLPIQHGKYKGKIAYIDWILRSETLYLNLNVTYYSTGLIKSCEALSQCLALEEIGDIRNIRTLSGHRFKKNFVYDKTLPVYTVLANRIISPKPFAIVDGGIERFASRDKILRKFGLQSLSNDV